MSDPTYRRWPCELTPETIATIRENADAINLHYTEYTRQLIAHGLTCAFFVPDTSVGRRFRRRERGQTNE